MKTKRSKLPILLTLFIFMMSSSIALGQYDDTQLKEPNDSHSPNIKLQHVTRVVSDFSKSRYFYLEVLGLQEIPTDWLPDNQMFISLGGNLELHMGEVEGIEVKPNNFNHFAISVPNLDEYLGSIISKGEIYGSLGKGDDKHISTRPDKVRQTFIKDPDGYWVEINDMYE
ncbi:VOC family protein [Marinigracilibium pacificum]|uniref:VOC domain-containing protein n=1 Tax=Marinigracilibium pacificum TaxID=2729599 RepID=A0A848J0H1_9BACT|nr:VOC family protein [Marinigracilibium pacificum]NMM47769.1 hypothetical protein [Marinigracilibium pacificum]